MRSTSANSFSFWARLVCRLGTRVQALDKNEWCYGCVGTLEDVGVNDCGKRQGHSLWKLFSLKAFVSCWAMSRKLVCRTKYWLRDHESGPSLLVSGFRGGWYCRTICSALFPPAPRKPIPHLLFFTIAQPSYPGVPNVGILGQRGPCHGLSISCALWASN
jgi:hypothetical protein